MLHVLLYMTCSYEYVLGSDIYLNAVFNQMYNNIISYSRCYQFNSCVCVCVCVCVCFLVWLCVRALGKSTLPREENEGQWVCIGFC